MYKLLLSWRYLRTRYIALASIISVTLGVATLIVVNSVMSGFTHEMHKRLHGILSDVVIESYETAGMPDPEWHMQQIREVIGDDVQAMTPVVHVPAMVNISVNNGRSITRPVNLIGIDEETYAQVCQFGPHLLHPENRKKLRFLLRKSGYAPNRDGFPPSGWDHRRRRLQFERDLQRQLQPVEANAEQGAPPSAVDSSADEEFDPTSVPLPEAPDDFPSASQSADRDRTDEDDEITTAQDPFGALRPQGPVFDAMQHQRTGVILGIAIGSTRHRDADNEVRDYFYCRPGDDVQITFPNASRKTEAVFDWFTVVDLYESKMSEYDSSFAFVPLRKLQEMRGMFDPESGLFSVTSIQLKLRPGANLKQVRDKLREHFPAHQYPYSIQSWRDMQGPLLAAVQLETTILNILLFLIIAVAGFGILATFFMIVVEKTRDIGILKALGAPSRGVMSIFLGYGLSLGIVGSGVGLVLGLLFVGNINEIATALERLMGQEVFPAEIYYFREIPTITQPLTVAWVAIGAVLIAVLASVLPAIRAARLHPVEALRYE